MPDRGENQPQSPPLRRVIGSVLASFFGVQGSRQHEEDFTHGHPLVYIAVAGAFVYMMVNFRGSGSGEEEGEGGQPDDPQGTRQDGDDHERKDRG